MRLSINRSFRFDPIERDRGHDHDRPTWAARRDHRGGNAPQRYATTAISDDDGTAGIAEAYARANGIGNRQPWTAELKGCLECGCPEGSGGTTGNSNCCEPENARNTLRTVSDRDWPAVYHRMGKSQDCKIRTEPTDPRLEVVHRDEWDRSTAGASNDARHHNRLSARLGPLIEKHPQGR